MGNTAFIHVSRYPNPSRAFLDIIFPSQASNQRSAGVHSTTAQKMAWTIEFLLSFCIRTATAFMLKMGRTLIKQASNGGLNCSTLRFSPPLLAWNAFLPPATSFLLCFSTHAHAGHNFLALAPETMSQLSEQFLLQMKTGIKISVDSKCKTFSISYISCIVLLKCDLDVRSLNVLEMPGGPELNSFLFTKYLDGRGLATIAAIFASTYDYKQS